MILVLGTGRSGTSEVASILRSLGVNMGESYHTGDEFNPNGYYEDEDFQKVNVAYVMLGLHNGGVPEARAIWEKQFTNVVASKQEPWGVKDPGIADFPSLLAYYMTLKPRIIFATRDKDDTLDSFMRMKNIARSVAEHIYNNRRRNIFNAINNLPYLEIDCYDKNKREKIEAWMKK